MHEAMKTHFGGCPKAYEAVNSYMRRLLAWCFPIEALKDEVTLALRI